MSDHDFKVRYYRGSENLAADCFSRINFVESNYIAIDNEEVKRYQKNCNETKSLLKSHLKHFKKRPNSVTMSLWSCRKDVEFVNGYIKIQGKIFIPKSLRLKCLTLAHGCHIG